jgi:hypothetical protein
MGTVGQAAEPTYYYYRGSDQLTCGESSQNDGSTVVRSPLFAGTWRDGRHLWIGQLPSPPLVRILSFV